MKVYSDRDMTPAKIIDRLKRGERLFMARESPAAGELEYIPPHENIAKLFRRGLLRWKPWRDDAQRAQGVGELELVPQAEGATP